MRLFRYNVEEVCLRAGVDEPLIMIDVDGETETMYWYHYDGLGSVVALSDSSGSIVERYAYDVFGQVTIGNADFSQTYSESQYGNPYMFTGRRFDPETGLYYYRARMYAPAIGRFLQPDPIGYADSMNLYGYVGNNPVNWTDPWGLATFAEEKQAIIRDAHEWYVTPWNHQFWELNNQCGQQNRKLYNYLGSRGYRKWEFLDVNRSKRRGLFFGIGFFPGNHTVTLVRPIVEKDEKGKPVEKVPPSFIIDIYRNFFQDFKEDTFKTYNYRLFFKRYPYHRGTSIFLNMYGDSPQEYNPRGE